MYSLLTVASLLFIVQVNGLEMFFDDDASYNPCQDKSAVYFYPHPTDDHKYYQCDESGIAYLRSCGDLVWDELQVACNWPSAVAAQPPRIISTPTTTTLPSTTSESLSTTITTSEPLSTTINTSFSLCKPINPCGDHGHCLEPPTTVPNSRRRFACICSENWFGRLCNEQTDELTTPPPPPILNFDQDNNASQPINTFSLPVMTEEDFKYIFYGLKDSNQVAEFNELQERTMDSNSKEEDDEVPTTIKTISY